MGTTIADAAVMVGRESAAAGVSQVGSGVGGILAAAALVYALAYLDLTLASDRECKHITRLLMACIIPLLFVFGGVILFEVIEILVETGT